MNQNETLKKTDISIVIPSYNHRKYINALLTSLISQKTEYFFEVIIVDSGTDDTAEYIRKEFPDIRLIKSEKRMYPGEARNAGVAAAQSDLIIFTDTDCTVDKMWIENIMTAYRENKKIVVGPVLNGTPVSLFGTVDYLLECFDFWNERDGIKIGTVGTGNVFFEKAIFEKYGPLDNFVKGSDSRFFRKVLAGGEVIYWKKNIRVWHHNRTQFFKVMKNQYKLGIGAAKTGRQFDSRAAFVMRQPWLVPFIPILRFIRIGWILLRKAPFNFAVYILLTPFILIGLTVHAFGFTVSAFNKNK